MKSTKNPVGRPRKPAASKRSECIRAKVTPREKAAIVATAEKEELTITDLIVRRCCQ